MRMNQETLLHWFRQIHLFSFLSEGEAQEALEACEFLEFEPGEFILSKGDLDDHLYLVYEGEVSLFVRKGEERFGVGRCGTGDYFNVEAAIWGPPAEIYARALRPCTVYRMPRSVLTALQVRHPAMRALLNLIVRARRRGRVLRPPWMKPHELLTLYERPHFAWLLFRLWGPFALLAGAASFLLLWLFFPEMEILLWSLAGMLGLLGMGWMAYLILEWRNDAAVVTSLRAMFIGRVVLVYESRQEIPLPMIVAVEVYTSFLDRVLGTGDVIVRTEGPSLRMEKVPSPYLWERVLKDYQTRHQRQRYREEEERVQRALRERLQLPTPPEPPKVEAPELEEQVAQPAWWKVLWNAWFGSRVEEGSIVTYRKHWYFLLESVWLPLLGFVGLMVVWAVHLLGIWKVFSWVTLTYMTVLIAVFLFLVFLWFYIEWHNDYYQITDSQVVDYKKIVLGPEQRHTAPLLEIRSLDYEHPGLLARLLDFGNVYIYTGGDKPLVFRHVANPAQAQYDIFLRMEQLRRRKAMEAWQKERERFIEWLAAYHTLAKEAFTPPSLSPKKEDESEEPHQEGPHWFTPPPTYPEPPPSY